jgi:hypothetical protein
MKVAIPGTPGRKFPLENLNWHDEERERGGEREK